MPGIGIADQRGDAGQRAVLAYRGRGSRRVAPDLAGHAGLRGRRMRTRGDVARWAEGPATRARTPSPPSRAGIRPRRNGSAARDGLGRSVRTRRQRGERSRRSGCHRADQRGRRCDPGGAALLPADVSRRRRRRGGAFPAHRRGDRRALQGERVDLGGRGRLSGRGRLGLLDGRRRAVRGARRDTRPGGERRGDRHGTQPRSDLRPGRRPRADSLHRTQRHGRRQGHQRRTHRAARRRPPHRQPGQGDQDDARDGCGHEDQVQGDRSWRPGGERDRGRNPHGRGPWGFSGSSSARAGRSNSGTAPLRVTPRPSRPGRTEPRPS